MSERASYTSCASSWYFNSIDISESNTRYRAGFFKVVCGETRNNSSASNEEPHLSLSDNVFFPLGVEDRTPETLTYEFLFSIALST